MEETRGMNGKRHSEATKAKMAAVHRGRKRTEEARANMSAGQRRRSDRARQAGLLKGRPLSAAELGSTHGNAGRKQSPEHVARRMAAKTETMRKKREAVRLGEI
jgi:hypothetical protein